MAKGFFFENCINILCSESHPSSVPVASDHNRAVSTSSFLLSSLLRLMSTLPWSDSPPPRKGRPLKGPARKERRTVSRTLRSMNFLWISFLHSGHGSWIDFHSTFSIVDHTPTHPLAIWLMCGEPKIVLSSPCRRRFSSPFFFFLLLCRRPDSCSLRATLAGEGMEGHIPMELLRYYPDFMCIPEILFIESEWQIK